MNLYLDASAIIYSIEGVENLRNAVLAWIKRAESGGGAILTSRLSRLECRVSPLRKGQSAITALYDGFFIQQAVSLVEIDASVIELATDLRVRHAIKTPDAIHVATAMVSRADLILTGDRGLVRCTEIRVQLI